MEIEFLLIAEENNGIRIIYIEGKSDKTLRKKPNGSSRLFLSADGSAFYALMVPLDWLLHNSQLIYLSSHVFYWLGRQISRQ